MNVVREPFVFSAQSFRQERADEGRKTQPIATPFWPKWDGHMALADVSGERLKELQPLAKTDSYAYSAALIIESLIIKDTGEQAYQPADRDELMKSGSTIIALMKEVNKFFGFDMKDAIEAAKNA